MKKSIIALLEVFRKNVFASKTIREISAAIGKDYPGVYNAVLELEDMHIIKTRRVGKAKLCEISFTPQAISTLSYLDEQVAFSREISNMTEILGFKEFIEDIVLVTGSFAKESSTKDSDLDLVVICKCDAAIKQRLLENLTALFHPKVHGIVFTQGDFLKMLLEKAPNFGKEVFYSRLLFRGASRYYELIKEAAENGFRG
jgi:predicted nucleotidyltransferase